ncbi:hypothetical protein JCGZ_11694 [Jatropha curcas]|uniref:Myb-like domain-containing protein n=1 Tax=Jatropha curcas TaxID=180498 RepID=A0A067K8I8_JATCU|nr:uncharacterized protein LOC105640600 [Jatropha curcas]XP_012080352.1 uncharacterized protein LOC105640600 [Jatropha curcas]KDP31318.1 hypothetical protein JCGZ_11694 [Jatropha curcas]
MVLKRPFYDEELYNISSKHPRQVDYNNRLVSFSEFVPPEVASLTPCLPGECGLTENAIEGHERLASDIVARFPVSVEKDVETIVPGRSLNSSSGGIGINEEAFHPEMAIYVSCTPEYFSPQRPTRTVAHHEDMYSLLLRYPPRKAIPIGSNHQADIPEWNPYDSKTTIKSSGTSGMCPDTNLLLERKDENRLMGTCVIPMPEFGLAAKVGNVRIDCNCLEKGSIVCVKQHIVEARENLKRILGKERFEQLGFCEMGEQVAEKWSEGEEQLFREVVFSNPASLGKNFWELLSSVFPSRSKKDIISYYFNVFMLRRRAEQNRCNSMNVDDSDNDEWQESDDYGDSKLVTSEEDEDSVVESPIPQEDCTHDQSWKDDLHVCDEGAVDYDCDDNEKSDFPYDRYIMNDLGTCPSASLDYGGSKPKDDSCASSDTGGFSQGTQLKAENDDHWPCSVDGLSYGSGQDNNCDIRVWDAGYLVCPKGNVDLLPTCSMIEEVFGKESWNCKARDG